MSISTVQNSSIGHAAAPHLPTELEREIFESVATNDFKARFSLIRVARRVREWIEPIMYRTIDIGRGIEGGLFSGEDALNALVSSKGSEFFSAHVRMFRIDDSFSFTIPTVLHQESLCFYLRTFSAITELQLWSYDHNKTVLELVFSLPQLTRLSLYRGPDFFRMLRDRPDSPLLDRLTHLQICNADWSSVPTWRLRSITHFSTVVGCNLLDDLDDPELEEMWGPQDVTDYLYDLDDFPRLEMLVLLIPDDCHHYVHYTPGYFRERLKKLGLTLGPKTYVIEEPDYFEGAHALGRIPVDLWDFARKERLTI